MLRRHDRRITPLAVSRRSCSRAEGVGDASPRASSPNLPGHAHHSQTASLCPIPQFRLTNRHLLSDELRRLRWPPLNKRGPILVITSTTASMGAHHCQPVASVIQRLSGRFRHVGPPFLQLKVAASLSFRAKRGVLPRTSVAESSIVEGVAVDASISAMLRPLRRPVAAGLRRDPLCAAGGEGEVPGAPPPRFDIGQGAACAAPADALCQGAHGVPACGFVCAGEVRLPLLRDRRRRRRRLGLDTLRRTDASPQAERSGPTRASLT